MSLQLKVPSMVCQGCIDTITKVITTEDSAAKVNANLENKWVTVDASLSKESVKQLITAAGHTVEE